MNPGRNTKPLTGIDDTTRHHLVTLARRPRAHTAKFTTHRPTDWRPTEIRNPSGVLDDHFTDTTAWELIAARLERGDKVTVIELDQPPGATGYVMHIDLGSNFPELYVKLEFGSGEIFGRSFHYSE